MRIYGGGVGEDGASAPLSNRRYYPICGLPLAFIFARQKCGHQRSGERSLKESEIRCFGSAQQPLFLPYRCLDNCSYSNIVEVRSIT